MWNPFRRKDKSESKPNLRELAYNVTPGELGLSPTSELPNVWGVIMDQGIPGGSATLVAFAEGTTSLYIGDRSGVIGAGRHESVRQASLILLRAAEGLINQVPAVAVAAQTPIGQVRFVLRTYAGDRSVVVPAAALAGQMHPISPLFVYGQEVITQIRLISQAREHSTR